MILLVDNYDSFVYNIYQYLGELGQDVLVKRNDAVSLEEIERLRPERIIISPGPCTPKEAGISVSIIRHLCAQYPILGVCLGHQCLGAAFGGRIVRLKHVWHGKTSDIHHTGKGLFRGIPRPFTATRYHSLIVEKESCPASLAITAWTDDGTIMGLQHKQYPLYGIQFHPESILTKEGKNILANFVGLSPP